MPKITVDAKCMKTVVTKHAIANTAGKAAEPMASGPEPLTNRPIMKNVMKSRIGTENEQGPEIATQ